MFLEWALGLWTGAGLVWWVVAWALVRDQQARGFFSSPPLPSDFSPLSDFPPNEFISVFKPLAPHDAEGMAPLEAGLESFIRQLDERSELLLGIHEVDRAAAEMFLARMREAYPKAKVVAVHRSREDEVSNPKIAWQKVLADSARGELWLWSDADIVAPKGFFAAMRAEWEQGVARMLTFPYVVREAGTGPALLNALYVNAEFYPGVLFLRRFGTVDFGLGAGMLFRRDDFLAKVEWEEIGAALADDFILGQRLRPVRISELTLATALEARTWREAVLHYLRWNKTVWWCRPGGSAARVMVLPVLGWMGAVAWQPGAWWVWVGLVAMMQTDVFFAGAIKRAVGCRWKVRDLLAMEAWSLGRGVAWLACWLPWAVSWRGRKWTGPQRSSQT